MKTGTFLLVSILAIFCGILVQQTAETLANTLLTVLPFNIKTVA